MQSCCGLPCPEQIRRVTLATPERCGGRRPDRRRGAAARYPGRGSLPRPAARERHRMTDPHTSMSLAAILVLTVVVMVTVVGWLAVVFLAGHQPVGGRARPGSEDPARARRPGAVRRHGDMPAGAHAAPPGGQPAADEPAARGGTASPHGGARRAVVPSLRPGVSGGACPWPVASIINCVAKCSRGAAESCRAPG